MVGPRTAATGYPTISKGAAVARAHELLPGSGRSEPQSLNPAQRSVRHWLTHRSPLRIIVVRLMAIATAEMRMDRSAMNSPPSFVK